MHKGAYGRVSVVLSFFLFVISGAYILSPAKCNAAGVTIATIYAGNTENHLKVDHWVERNSFYSIEVFRNNYLIDSDSGGKGDIGGSVETFDITDVGQANQTKTYRVRYTVTTYYYDDEDERAFSEPITSEYEAEIPAGLVSGTIRSGYNIVWNEASYIMTGYLTIEKGASLTINPPVTVSPYYSSFGFIAKGKLHINGAVFDGPCNITAFDPD